MGTFLPGELSAAFSVEFTDTRLPKNLTSS